MHIRVMTPEDWPSVREIYEAGIATRNATFASKAPEWPDWDKEHIAACRLIAEHDSRVAGWAALTSVSNRCVYAGVAEVSVYVDAAARGTGVGRALLSALVDASEAQGLWTLQAGILPENVASVRLHERCGFRIVGRRERIGQMDGEWRDVLLLERRSAVI
jgi:phosphinothricin acetyltransferase